MPLIAMEMTGYTKNETAVIGDRIYTDIKSGLNAGIKNILVLSGETTLEILENSADKPDLVLDSGKEILEALLSLSVFLLYGFENFSQSRFFMRKYAVFSCNFIPYMV